MKRILLDVDGVVADFIGKTFQDLVAEGGPAHTAEDLQEWDLHVLVHEKWDATMESFWHREGWVDTMHPYQGAREGVHALRDAGHEVYWVTTAMHAAPFWMWERRQWLLREMDATDHDILFASHKHIVLGDIFVDDKPANVSRWAQAHPKGHGVLWAQPWNRLATFSSGGRTNKWENILHLADGKISSVWQT